MLQQNSIAPQNATRSQVPRQFFNEPINREIILAWKDNDDNTQTLNINLTESDDDLILQPPVRNIKQSQQVLGQQQKLQQQQPRQEKLTKAPSEMLQKILRRFFTSKSIIFRNGRGNESVER